MHVLTAAAFAMIAAPVLAASLSTQDSGFLSAAVQIQAGRFALASYEQQHGSGRVKAFAATMLAQSSQDSRMLDGLAKHYSVTPPKGLLVQDQYHYSQLYGMSGSALDATFVRELRISDQINADTYKQEAQSGSNATLKTYAKRYSAALQHEISTLSHL